MTTTERTGHIGIWGELGQLEHTLRYVDVPLDGHPVRTRVLQAGTGPDLVLLHGTGGHLEAYARDPGLRSRHGDAGLAFAKTMDWDRINAAVMQVYQRVIRRRARRR